MTHSVEEALEVFRRLPYATGESYALGHLGTAYLAIGEASSSAGASAPEVLVDGVLDAFRDRYDVTIERVVTAEENVSFKIPRSLRAA